MVVQRFDRATVDNFARMSNGSLRAKANLTKVGVFPYRAADGTIVREYRPAEEVFAVDALNSLRGITLTWMHPKEFVNETNWKELAIGHVSDNIAQHEDVYASGDVVVSSADGIAKVETNGGGELSCGYDCVLVNQSGVTDSGEQFDAIQTKIVYNHVALLPKGAGRLGRDVALRTDAAEQIEATKEENEPMATHRIDGKDYTAGSPEHLAAVDAQIASLVIKVSEADKRADAAEAARKVAEAKSDPKAIKAAADKRAMLITRAARDGVKHADEGTDDEILLAILKKAHPSLDFAALALSHEQLMTMLASTVGGGDKPDAPKDPHAGDPPKPPDGAAAPAPPRADSIDAARGGNGPANAGRRPQTEAEALKARQDATNNAWKGPKK